MKDYSLKTRIHELCSGHGAMHLTYDELSELFNQFAENHDDIVALIDKADSDNYLIQLAAFIERSNFNDHQKQAAYRKAYKKVSLEWNGGNKWTRTLIKLVEDGGVLTADELRQYHDVNEVRLGKAIQKALSQRQEEANAHEDALVSARETNDMEGSSGLHRRHVVAWLVFTFVCVLGFSGAMVWKKRHRESRG